MHFAFYCHLNKYLEMLISSRCLGLWTKKYGTDIQFNNYYNLHAPCHVLDVQLAGYHLLYSWYSD
jgi:hypothetical protein